MAGIYQLIQEPSFICTTEATILNLALISFDLCGTGSVRRARAPRPPFGPRRRLLFAVTVTRGAGETRNGSPANEQPGVVTMKWRKWKKKKSLLHENKYNLATAK